MKTQITFWKKQTIGLFMVLLSFAAYAQTAPLNTRLFQINTAANDGKFSKQFHRHLNSAKEDMFFTTLAEGKGEFFNYEFDNGYNVFSRYITRLGEDGLTKWVANFYNASNTNILGNVSKDFACTDKDDNFYFLAGINGTSSVFSDGVGNFKNFSTTSAYSQILIKLDKNGKFLWSKQLNQSGSNLLAVATDSVGNVYLMGEAPGSLSVDNFSIPSDGNRAIFFIKFSNEGNILYSKYYKNMGLYSLNPVFDSQDNLYVFSEPINYSGNDYVFDSVTIPATSENMDHIMLKFDNSGNVIWGKNFYANAPANIFGYSWPNDTVFDGTDFIVMGNYYADINDPNYLGLDLAEIPKAYSGTSYVPFFAKVNTNGNVIWQKAIDSNNSNTGNYNNIDLDENKNIYMYYSARDKVNINGTEYSFDATNGNKIFLKLDTNGNLKYYNTVDNGMTSTNFIDVIGEDKINISGFAGKNSIFNYNINNLGGTNIYIATFGNLDKKYLTPENNYLQLTNVDISNNAGNSNTFSFDLINNVNWAATSDQNWLGLSFTKLSEKNTMNTISGTGDAKITLTAETNITGTNRSANILISGDGGVSSKTVVVTQTGALSVQDTKTFVTVIYPNPSSDFLNIQTDQKVSKTEIFDLSGKLLKSNTGNNKIEISSLLKGLYIIKIYTNSGIINSKFIKN